MMTREEFWQLTYVIALYKGSKTLDAKKQADSAAAVADESMLRMDESFPELPEEGFYEDRE